MGPTANATTAPITVGDSSNFDTAIATGGGTAQASDGIFELARALHTGTVGSQGAYAEYGKFIIAQASGSGAYAYGGDGGAFQIASARGNSSDAETYDGYFDIARALGNSSSAYAYEGSLSLATALGENAEAEAEYGMAQIAQALGNTTIAKALYGRAQIAQALGYKADAEAQASNTAGQGGGNIALASFNSDAYAGDALGSGNLAVAMIDTYAYTDGTRNTAISAFGASESNAYDGPEQYVRVDRRRQLQPGRRRQPQRRHRGFGRLRRGLHRQQQLRSGERHRQQSVRRLRRRQCRPRGRERQHRHRRRPAQPWSP